MQNYSFSVTWSVEDGEYVAISAEFPGLSGLGATAEDAVRELRDAMDVAVEALVEDGEPVPSPRVVQDYSGQLRLRLPKSLHAAAATKADEEGVSLNALLQSYIAQGLGVDRSSLKSEYDLRRLVLAIDAFTRAQAPHVEQAGARPTAVEQEREHVRYAVPATLGLPREKVIPIQDFLHRQPRQRTTVYPEQAIPLLPVEAYQ